MRVLSELSCLISIIKEATAAEPNTTQRIRKDWTIMAEAGCIQSRGFAIVPSPIPVIHKIPSSQKPSMTYLSLNMSTRLWSFYVSHLGLESAWAVMSGGVDAILYHHRANLNVLFSYCDSYLRSYFLLDPDESDFSLFLSLSLSIC